MCDNVCEHTGSATGRPLSQKQGETWFACQKTTKNEHASSENLFVHDHHTGQKNGTVLCSKPFCRTTNTVPKIYNITVPPLIAAPAAPSLEASSAPLPHSPSPPPHDVGCPAEGPAQKGKQRTHVCPELVATDREGNKSCLGNHRKTFCSVVAGSQNASETHKVVERCLNISLAFR